MKVINTIYLVLLITAVISKPVFAVEYGVDHLEVGNPGGWGSSNKTFDDDFIEGGSAFLDIWLKDLQHSPSEQMLTAGFAITYDPTITIVNTIPYYDNTNLVP